MKRHLSLATAIPAAVAALTLSLAPSAASAGTAPASAASAASTASAASAASARAAARQGRHTGKVQAACGRTKPGQARCLALIRTGVHGGLGVRGRAALAAGEGAAKTALPAGYGRPELRPAYKLPATGGSGQTVAVVEAFDDPTAEADLAVYRTTYGLPACTTANGCFTKVNEEGQQGNYPQSDSFTGWSVETSLDLDMVSAICPSCHILLVEANTVNDSDLAEAANEAAGLGATEISNSYGDTEGGADLQLAPDYRHPGVAVTASTGDDGFGIPLVPAVLRSVIAVGGTTLQKDPGSARGWSETAWSGSGSGCSGYVAKPAWQTGAPDCPNRVTADVSADADPSTGVAIYDTTPDIFVGPGWNEVGGTSAAAPMIAGVIALAGNPGALPTARYIYQHAGHLNDVTSGSNANNGFDCGGNNLCNAVPGYDGPTGLGTPEGTRAF
jgi:subtilase family serine protease